ncbi:653_t:CDS:2 [Scutellospora calospora]|uniref:653_t:CDS:1 n=1 Tax=Scutellospora calospora TaxID=85575 RepID=A0ACA9K4S6_9GLOM|nr:653_t:CDS:2 [Scutellospora calospora]
MILIIIIKTFNKNASRTSKTILEITSKNSSETTYKINNKTTSEITNETANKTTNETTSKITSKIISETTNIYLYIYYSLSTVKYSSNNNKMIVDTETDTLMFEDHVDDFFKYVVKQIYASKNDSLYEVKQYLDKQIAI